MKRNKYSSIALFIFTLFLGSCRTEEEIRICGTQCQTSKPWTVESFDLGLPCFTTQDSCLQWAGSHGYGGKPCVKCD